MYLRLTIGKTCRIHLCIWDKVTQKHQKENMRPEREICCHTGYCIRNDSSERSMVSHKVGPPIPEAC